jgi:hypothetical protein
LKADLGQEELLRHMTVHSFSIFLKDAAVSGQNRETMHTGIPLNSENYTERLYALRKFVFELGTEYIEEYFVSQFQKTSLHLWQWSHCPEFSKHGKSLLQ